MAAELIAIEVAYARPERQHLLALHVPPGTTLAEAIAASGLRELYPEQALENAPTGIWGQLAGPDTPVSEGDRIEIYRPLIADPKASRRARAEVNPLPTAPGKKRY